VSASYRPATPADLEAQHAVFCRAEGALRRAHGYAWVDPPLGWFASVSGHVLATDPERCFVAEIDGRVVGFSAALVRDDVWFFAALFIDPDRQGQGIGRRLFDLAAAAAPPRRVTITDSIQPISTALYARNGLIPTVPLLLFEGRPSVEAPADLAVGEALARDLLELDRAGYGFDRSIDHPFWSRQRTRTVWTRKGKAVGYAYHSMTGSIGPLVGRDPATAADCLRAELAVRPRAIVEVPGTARELVEVALGAGLRLVPPPGILLLSRGMQAPDRIAISNYFLY
jgi:GNAT superfamily N-acetyltransferase